MMRGIVQCFFTLSGAVLLIVSASKLIVSFAYIPISLLQDPVFLMPIRQVLRMVALIELIAALICFFGHSITLRAVSVAWLSSCFVLYHLGLHYLGYHKPCNCLGLLTEILHISPRTADIAIKVILAYLLIGSYATLFWLWRLRKQTSLHPSA
jgi:hypothetical protein